MSRVADERGRAGFWTKPIAAPTLPLPAERPWHVARPAVGFDDLKERLAIRLRHLGIEYDPAPPFDAGAPGKAPAEVRAAAEARAADCPAAKVNLEVVQRALVAGSPRNQSDGHSRGVAASWATVTRPATGSP